MDYTEFAEKVFEADPNFVRDTVESMYGGTALILKKSMVNTPLASTPLRKSSGLSNFLLIPSLGFKFKL